MTPATLLAALAFALVVLPRPGLAETDGPRHGLALHGDVRHPAGFAQFDYVNPAAPKGGDIRLHAVGTFDSFNPFILRGVAAGAIGYTYETLMVPSGDEPLARYCLVCKSVEVAADRSWVEFVLRDDARFHDGSPVTVDDVAWSFQALKRDGHPFYRTAYVDVTGAAAAGERTVRFTLRPGAGRMLPLLLGDLPVLARRWWAGRDFARTSLEPPLGSGPYRIDSFEPGRHVTIRRVADHWAKDHPVNRGRWNFDTIRFDYYRDETVALEAFKAGEYDIRFEEQATAWATKYRGPAFDQALIRKAEIAEDRVSGMQGYVMNTRRQPFADRRFRAAIIHAFDFEWKNRALLHGAYTRTRSYFNNADLSARGMPGPAELQILEPWRGRIPDEVFTVEYNPPRSDGEGGLRANRRAAMRLLQEAGYRLVRQRLVDTEGHPVSFEILLHDPQLERVTLPYVENLRRIGIEARVRTVDAAQYAHRLHHYDFDMTVALFGQSEAPGAEQRHYWGSHEADTPGGRNLAGVRDPAVDAVVQLLIEAGDRDSLVARTRALDRLLQWGFYAVPHWHAKVDRVAYRSWLARPTRTPKHGADITTWWSDGERRPSPGEKADAARR